MRILVNSKDPNGISYLLHQQGFKNLPCVEFNNFDAYEEFDVVLFFKYNLKPRDIEVAKKKNKNLLIGIIDPRQYLSKQFRSLVDFLVVDSIEMKDFYSYLGKPILSYYEFESTLSKKKSDNGDITYIGYHGNKVHLLSMYPVISNVMRELSKEHPIKLLLLYNYESLGKLPSFITKGIEVEYLQWNLSNLKFFLEKTDIGIVPNFSPVLSNKYFKAFSLPFAKTFVTHQSDYLVRYKMTSGPNRILTFALNKIPIVSDMYPSACQIIDNEEDGFLVNSHHGWYTSLKKLIVSKQLRKKFSTKMHFKYEEKFNYKVQNDIFHQNLKELLIVNKKETSTEDIVFRSGWGLVPLIYFVKQELYAQLKELYRKILK